MLRIGVTGGIGTGKTTVCKIFELLGAPVFYADSKAKELYNNNDELKQKIIETFGKEMYIPKAINQQSLIFNKEKMRSLIFNDSAQLQLLNNIVHPIIKEETEKWFAKQSGAYALKEAALIIETNTFDTFDELILIESPIDIRMKRVVLRDHLSADEIKKRIQSQLPEEEKRRYATQIIANDEKTLLIPQVLSLHHQFLKKAHS
jgi:dephospho-CoA kinase